MAANETTCSMDFGYCQEAFIAQNLPDVRKPDTTDKADPNCEHDVNLRKEISDHIRVAGVLERRSLELRDVIRRYSTGPEGETDDERDTRTRGLGQLLTQLERVQTTKEESYQAAIDKTIDLFNLRPKITQQIPRDSYKNEPANPWQPAYLEFDGPGRRLTDDENRKLWADHKIYYRPNLPVPPFHGGGTTLSNATIYIPYGGFASPEKLAGVIYHETVHWLHHNALGRGPNPSEDYRNEELAYRLQASKASIFGYNDGEIAQLKTLESAYHERAATASIDWNVERAKHPTEFLNSAAVIDETSGFGELDADLKRGIDLAREARQRQSSIEESMFPKAPGAVAVPAQLAAPEDPGAAAQPAYLAGNGARMAAAMARNVCESPNGVSDPLFDYLTWQESDPEEAARISPSLSGCVRAVFDKMVRTLSSGYRLNAALARSFIPPPQAPVVTPRSRSRDRDDEPPSRHSPDDWSSLRQLRGLNR